MDLLVVHPELLELVDEESELELVAVLIGSNELRTEGFELEDRSFEARETFAVGATGRGTKKSAGMLPTETEGKEGREGRKEKRELTSRTPLQIRPRTWRRSSTLGLPPKPRKVTRASPTVRSGFNQYRGRGGGGGGKEGKGGQEGRKAKLTLRIWTFTPATKGSRFVPFVFEYLRRCLWSHGVSEEAIREGGKGREGR